MYALDVDNLVQVGLGGGALALLMALGAGVAWFFKWLDLRRTEKAAAAKLLRTDGFAELGKALDRSDLENKILKADSIDKQKRIDALMAVNVESFACEQEAWTNAWIQHDCAKRMQRALVNTKVLCNEAGEAIPDIPPRRDRKAALAAIEYSQRTSAQNTANVTTMIQGEKEARPEIMKESP